jgi:steroid delta-isomerase-like uncharacterized protein
MSADPASDARFGDPGFLEAWGAAWSCGDPERLLPFYAADGCYRDIGSNLTFNGHEAIASFYRLMLKFAPDSLIEFGSAHGDPRGFAAEWTWSGTAAGPLKTPGGLYPATGASFSVHGVAYCTLNAGGVIATHDDYYDMLDVVRQVQAVEGAA